MSEQIDWSKAPEGADKYNTHNSMFYKGERPDLQVFIYDQWAQSAIVKSNEFFVYRPATRSWSGKGLPPVGVVCEANFVGEWKRFEMRYYGEAYVVFKTAFEVQRARYDFDTCGVKFRPIRTHEQVAADEREAAIDKACADIEKQMEGFNVQLSYSLAIRATVEAMIDKGYRKP